MEMLSGYEFDIISTSKLNDFDFSAPDAFAVVYERNKVSKDLVFLDKTVSYNCSCSE